MTRKAIIDVLRTVAALADVDDWQPEHHAELEAAAVVARGEVGRWDRAKAKKDAVEANRAARQATTKRGGVVALKVAGKSAAWHRSRSWVMHRANGLCQARCATDCEVRGSHAHHMQMRSQGGSDGTENLLWLCPPCHRWVHDHPEESYAAGWLRRSGALPPVQSTKGR